MNTWTLQDWCFIESSARSGRSSLVTHLNPSSQRGKRVLFYKYASSLQLLMDKAPHSTPFQCVHTATRETARHKSSGFQTFWAEPPLWVTIFSPPHYVPLPPWGGERCTRWSWGQSQHWVCRCWCWPTGWLGWVRGWRWHSLLDPPRCWPKPHWMFHHAPQGDMPHNLKTSALKAVVWLEWNEALDLFFIKPGCGHFSAIPLRYSSSGLAFPAFLVSFAGRYLCSNVTGTCLVFPAN